MVDSLFVGETENIGNPTAPSEKAYGRSLPFPKLADFPTRGYEFYDFHHELDNNTFVNYQDNATRKTGAISYLMFTSFGMSSNNIVSRSKFINAKPVYFPPIENRWSNDDYGNTVYKTAVFKDADGTITGVPNSTIVNVTGIDADKNCELRPTWNAYVCTGDIGRMTVGGGGGAVGFGGFGGGGGPPGAGGPACRWRSTRGSRPRRRRCRCRQARCHTGRLCHRPRRWSDPRHACAVRSAGRSQPQRQGVHRRRRDQRARGQRVQGDDRTAYL